MLRRSPPGSAAVLVLAFAVACGSGAGSAAATITVGTEKVPVAHLVDAVAGLCHAAAVAPSDPKAARAAFFDRSHDALHTVARALEPVDRALAAQLLEAMQKVESELDTAAPNLAADLGTLLDVDRSGLGRLAITAPPCVE